MSVSLLAIKFILLITVSIPLLTWLRGAWRQIVFLGLNLFFVFFVLGTVSSLAILGFCVIGYGLCVLHRAKPDFPVSYSILILVALFIYMRGYEILEFVVPESLLLTWLRTIGLSFVLFKMIHVLVDLKGGMIRDINFLTHLNYCTNFTTFMMGPIQRFQDYYDQWSGVKEAIPATFEAHLDAMLRILVGYVKAYILGAMLADVALQSNTDVTQLEFTELVIQLYAFYFFLYLNFSGYCDIVIGAGSLFGVRPPENFNMPFIAQNISDFWLRQHRSLTLWLTDYVFTPAYKWALTQKSLAQFPLLAGNMAIILTMLVSGIWHGTTIGFLFFGLVHGFYFVVYRTWDQLLVNRFGRKRVKQIRKAWPSRIFGIFLTFHAAAFAFLFFQLDTTNLLILLDEVFSS